MERLPVSGIEVFLAIVREGSLRGAARALGLGAPAVSQQLKALERRIGVDLMVRTTRSVELTEAGRTLLAGAGPAYAELAGAIEGTRAAGQATAGTLHLTLQRSAYRLVVGPALRAFQDRYPQVRLDLSMNEGLVDLVAEGFHAGFRLGDRLSGGMVATRLTGALPSCWYATPAYLDAHGRPRHPRDLLSHRCVRYKSVTANRLWDWQFMENGQVEVVDPPVRLVFDNMQFVTEAVLDGNGIGWSLRGSVARELDAGALETVLDAYAVEMPPLYIHYPEQNRRLELLRLFVDFLSVRSGAP